jgi:cob(I)alamin adenosyltransferase
MAGARSFAAIAEWAADTPVEVLAQLGVCRCAPSEATIRRVLSRLLADMFDAGVDVVTDLGDRGPVGDRV